MASFDEWSDEAEAEVNGHKLRLVTLRDGHGAVAQEKAVEILPDHYASPEQVAHVFERLGKEAAAEYLRQKLPNTVPTLGRFGRDLCDGVYRRTDRLLSLCEKAAVARSSRNGHARRRCNRSSPCG